jgi:hypothetical protein
LVRLPADAARTERLGRLAVTDEEPDGDPAAWVAGLAEDEDTMVVLDLGDPTHGGAR